MRQKNSNGLMQAWMHHFSAIAVRMGAEGMGASGCLCKLEGRRCPPCCISLDYLSSPNTSAATDQVKSGSFLHHHAYTLEPAYGRGRKAGMGPLPAGHC